MRSVLSGRVAGATGFWNVEGVELRARRPGLREFRVDDYGAPAYPELVLAVTRQTLQDRPSLVRATVAALARGYEEVLSDPENGVTALTRRRQAAPTARSSSASSTRSRRRSPQARAASASSTARAWSAGRAGSSASGSRRRVPEVGLAFDGRYVPAPGRD